MAHPVVETLERMTEDELTTYVRARLLGRLSEPMVAWSQGDVPERFLIDAYALSADEEFKSRLKQIMKRLLVSWRPGLHDDVMYGSRLIYLTGRLGIEGGDSILSRLAAEPALEHLTVYDEPMKNFVLRTLLDFPGQEARPHFWEPLLDDPRHFDTAFFAISLRGAEEGLRCLPQYVHMALQTGLREAVLELRLANFIARHLWPDRLRELREALKRLPGDEKERVLAILARAIPSAVEKMQAISGLPQLAQVINISARLRNQQGRGGGPARALELPLAGSQL